VQSGNGGGNVMMGRRLRRRRMGNLPIAFRARGLRPNSGIPRLNGNAMTYRGRQRKVLGYIGPARTVGRYMGRYVQ
jgi:hypothetical protein